MSLGIFVYNQYMADAHTFISSESGYGKVNRIQERKLRIQPWLRKIILFTSGEDPVIFDLPDLDPTLNQ